MTTTTAAPITSADKAWADKMARLSARKPQERFVTFVDDDLVTAAEEAFQALGRAEALSRQELREKFKDKPQAERAALVEKALVRDKNVVKRKREHEAAAQAAADAEVKLLLRGLSPHLYESLQAQCPPTDAQRKQGMTYNVDRFAPQLVSACCVDPMTPEQAASLIGGEYEVTEEVDGQVVRTGKWEKVDGTLVFGEAALLFNTAANLNEGAQARLGKE
jgi:hypothetical protein